MNTFVFVLEIIGTVAFAISGALLGIKKNFDIFGIIMLGVITSVGGGFIRDISIGATPPAMFSKPVYCAVAVVSGVFACLPVVRNRLNRNSGMNNVFMIIMDSAGLASFTVTGVICAYAVYPDNVFLMIFTGVITGIGGGLVRDIISGERPYVFTKHIYACASIIGAIACAWLLKYSIEEVAVCAGMLAVLVIRFASAYYRINLPHVRNE